MKEVKGQFRAFAAAYPDLRLYRRICEGAADDDEVAGLLLAAPPGQARPVLLLAALHDLVLRRPDLPAARWYPSVTGQPVPPGDPWPEVRATALAHAAELREVIATRSTQTNEVNRAVYLAPLVARAGADTPGAPLALVELGSSAGLLLGLDRYRIELRPSPSPPANRVRESRPDGDSRTRNVGSSGGVVLGDPYSPVTCAGEFRGDLAAVRDLSLPRIVERVGLDRSPVDLADTEAVRWLEACLWPDVPGRLERFRSAVALAAPDSPGPGGGLNPPAPGSGPREEPAVGDPSARGMAGSEVHGPGAAWGSGIPPWISVAGDMVEDLVAVGHAARAMAVAVAGPEAPDVHLVVMSSWALTYVAREDRLRVAEALAELAADGRPVSWLTAEPPGCVPGLPAVAGRDAGPPGGITVLGARRWRHGQELAPAVWGTAHPHGEWVGWGPPA